MPTPEELYGQQAPSPEERYGPQPIVPEVAKPREATVGERMLEEAPQTVGGIGGGVAGGIAGAPLGPLGIILGSVGGAGLFGAAAKGYQNIYRSLFGEEEKAPKTSYEAAVDMAKAGGEEAAWDLGGQLGARALGKIFHTIRPKAVDDIEKLAIQLEKGGGKFTAAQRSDSWLLHQLDSLTRGSLTGSGRMKAIDTLNETAIKNIEGELRQKIAKNVTNNLSDQELGQLFLNTVKGGRAAHRTVVGEMYGGFDDLVPTRMVQQVLPDGSAAVKELKPVSTEGMKKSLTPFRKQLERLKYAGESSESKKLLDDIFAQDETLTFSDAQALRSSLLDAQRNLEGTMGKSKISGKVNKVIDEITKAMDEAALKESTTTLSKYRAIKNYARKGYEVFDNKFLGDMIIADKKNAEKIGEHVFRVGNVTEIQQVKKALRYAAKFGKEEGISYDATWKQMQSGYLDSLLRRSSTQAEIGAGTGVEQVVQEGLDVSGARLLKEFTDPKKARTLAATFDKPQRQAILEFAKIAERVQRKPEGGLGMLMQLTQAGAIYTAATGDIDPREAAMIFLAPAVLARIMTNPTGAKIMATALQTSAGSGQAGGIISQLAGYIHAVQQEEEKR